MAVSILRQLRELVRPPTFETLTPEDFQRLYRTLGVLLPMLAVLNLASRLFLSQRRVEAVDQFLAANLVCLGLAELYVLSVRWLRPNLSRLRWQAVVLIALLQLATCAGQWLHSDEPTLPLYPLLNLVLIGVCRAFLDARLGLVALLVSSVFESALMVLLLAGLLPYGALTLGPPAVELGGKLFFQAWCWRLGLYVIGWALIGHITNRFRRAAADLAFERRARMELIQRFAERDQGRLSGMRLSGRYRLLEVLGRGGMGEVYRAEDERSGRQVAVKVLHGHLAIVPEMVARFRREIDALARVPEAATVRLFESDVSPEGEPFLVMELLRGEDLGSVLRRREIVPVAEVVELVRAIAQALSAAHSVGVVHRDLKPQNIFLVESTSENPSVRLLDFGIAKLVEEVGDGLTRTAAVLGSPGFISPEQARGDGASVGPAADVFALGALAYRMLTGLSAFPSRSTASAVYEALYHHPMPPSQVRSELHAELDAPIAIALAKNVADRCSNAREFARDLAAAAAGRLNSEVAERARRLPIRTHERVPTPPLPMPAVGTNRWS